MTRHWRRGSSLKHRKGLARRTPMKRGGMKRDALDALWSRYVRLRDGYRCQWEGCQPTCSSETRTKPCGRLYPSNSKGYHAAHFFSRGKQSTRVTPEAGIGLCYPHHQHADHNKKSCFHPWLKQRLGEQTFELLRVQSRTPMVGMALKLHRDGMRIWLTQAIEQLEARV